MKLPPNYLDVEQGSAEWFQARCGCVTASRVDDATRKLKNGGESATRQSYKLELLAEILTGNVLEHYVSRAMDFGTENEPLARANYEFSKGVEVERIGYVFHPTIKRAGASPDGLVGEDGLIEVKCPNTTTHLAYLLGEQVPSEYKPQMMFQMACTGRKFCDFCSYDPRLPEDLSLFVARLERDDKLIAQMEHEVEKFLAEVNEMAERLLKHKGDGIEDALRASLAGVPRAEIPTELLHG